MNQSTRSGGSKDPSFNAVDLLERNRLAGRSERPYLRADRIWSYQEVAEAADAAGAGLLDIGLSPGDRVILATGDRPEFVITFWGAMKAGLVPIPVAPMLAASDFHFIMADSGARAVVCDAQSVGAVLPSIEGGKVSCLIVEAAVPDGARRWADVCTRPTPLATAAVANDDIALWLYTSGTTGLPKAVMHRHRSVLAAPGGLTGQVLRTEADDRVMSASRVFFAYGLGNSVYLTASAGASVVLSASPVIPAMVHGLMKKHQPSLLFGVPAFYRGFTSLPEADLPASVRAAVSAGEALDGDLFDRFKARFSLPLLDGLGSTEALHHFTSNTPDDVVAGSSGRALAGYEVRACDTDLQPVAEGEGGELWVRGPTTFAGYWRRPELTERAFDGDWIRTGDRVRIVDGRVHHEGRLDDLVKLGGIWVAPSEVEDVLRSHPEVSDAAVVAVDDGSGVPVLTAFITLSTGAAEPPQDLRRLCRTRLAAFKVPQIVRVVGELPRTPSGKVRRFVLRKGELTQAEG